MKAISSPRSSDTPPSSPSPPEVAPRRQFALTGPSVRLDPGRFAVRGDLADVRLVDQVFAPHYAQAMTCLVSCETPLLSKAAGGEHVALLVAGDVFELLELAGARGWGVAPRHGLVGYCDRAALELA